MKYMMVLQFRDNILNYEELIKLENMLIECLNSIAHVDGHDVGVDEMNIFILTSKINHVFDKVKTLFEEKIKKPYIAAYREVSGDQYIILHPRNLQKFTIS